MVVSFALPVVWGNYTRDFLDGKMIRDEQGNYLPSDMTDEESEECIEEALGIVALKECQDESDIQAYRNELAAELGVHVHRIQYFYLDSNRQKKDYHE